MRKLRITAKERWNNRTARAAIFPYSNQMEPQVALKAVAAASLGYGAYMILTCPCEGAVACKLPRWYGLLALSAAAVAASNALLAA